MKRDRFILQKYLDKELSESELDRFEQELEADLERAQSEIDELETDVARDPAELARFIGPSLDRIYGELLETDDPEHLRKAIEAYRDVSKLKKDYKKKVVAAMYRLLREGKAEDKHREVAVSGCHVRTEGPGAPREAGGGGAAESSPAAASSVRASGRVTAPKYAASSAEVGSRQSS